MILATRIDAVHEALAAERDAIGHHFALRDRRAKTPGRRQQHLAFGGHT
jgi:hypothetical protein